jgi:hypothetical protein
MVADRIIFVDIFYFKNIKFSFNYNCYYDELSLTSLTSLISLTIVQFVKFVEC